MFHSDTERTLRVHEENNAYRNKVRDRRIRYTHTVGSFMWKVDMFRELVARSIIATFMNTSMSDRMRSFDALVVVLRVTLIIIPLSCHSFPPLRCLPSWFALCR